MRTQTTQHACTIVVTATNVDGTTETTTIDPTSPVYPLYALQLAALLENRPDATATCSTGTDHRPALGAYNGPLNRALATCLLTFAAMERAPGCTDNVPGMEHYELDGEHMVTCWEALKRADPATLTRAVFDAMPPEQQKTMRDATRCLLTDALTEHADALKGDLLRIPFALHTVRKLADIVLGIPETARMFDEAAKDGGKVH